ncbi:glucuronyltransferase-S, putative [Pediculus humanus corporis]|uniref:Galactosylgalactosylxylosylprotein 3-beta-glucuronosyltransferase n=1 Tax=Pediculus humanus subsp. corporis TaxID=121224 RepID=E0VA90_PEDHC|nr:glucuronyltransferase-S, putative [Pediculus humanus corporis]EEB10296.1 glucuronyltransferase-S, putative [Pediculus humanus corporis]
MDSFRKLWLLIFLGAGVLMLQYHVSTTWNTTNISVPSSYSSASTSGSEEIVQAVVSKLQLDTSIVNVVGKKYIQELALQISRELISSSKGCDYSISNTIEWPEPTLYLITPTYRRPEQLAELTRMAQTLMHVRNLVWLVIEDANSTTELVTKLLDKTGIEYHHMIAPMPEQFRKKKIKPRGVSNRNRGLEWIRANATKGVLYFADDDNTYDISLFQEIRTTKKVSMFPVGLCTKFGVSSPVVKNGTFAGFYDGWLGGRKFPVDMAGFAINLDFLLKRPKASMPYKPGFEEDGFLRSLSPFEPKEVELKADNCTKILVWHTQARKNEPSAAVDFNKYGNTNIIKLKKILV